MCIVPRTKRTRLREFYIHFYFHALLSFSMSLRKVQTALIHSCTFLPLRKPVSITEPTVQTLTFFIHLSVFQMRSPIVPFLLYLSAREAESNSFQPKLHVSDPTTLAKSWFLYRRRDIQLTGLYTCDLYLCVRNSEMDFGSFPTFT